MAQVTKDTLKHIAEYAKRSECFPLTANELSQLANMAAKYLEVEEQPVARILHWNGPANAPIPEGGICARTYAEFPKGAGENGGYWREGAPLVLGHTEITKVGDGHDASIEASMLAVLKEPEVDFIGIVRRSLEPYIDDGMCKSCVDNKCVTGEECVTLGRDDDRARVLQKLLASFLQNPPDISLEDLDKLQAIAEKATPGPWDWGGTECKSKEEAVAMCRENIEKTKEPSAYFCEVYKSDAYRTAMVGNGPNGINNAAFIAAANPKTVLALIRLARLVVEHTKV